MEEKKEGEVSVGDKASLHVEKLLLFSRRKATGGGQRGEVKISEGTVFIIAADGGVG